MALFSSRRALNSKLLGTWGLLAVVACAPKQRDLSQLMQSDADGGKQSAGGQNGSAGNTVAPSGGTATTQAGATSTGVGGSSSVGGTSTSGGQSALAGQPSNGGAIAAGGGTAVQGGNGGATSPNGGASGALGIGGATVGVGGVTSAGGATVGVGGVTNAGGTTIGVGGTVGIGGAIIGVGGVAGVGGGTVCATVTPEVCNDGIDNDCNGTVDCPNVTGRFPEPGRAASGDDVWVQLTAPVKALKQVECRSGKPNLVGNKLWLVCDTTNPKALTVYSMGLAEAKLPENNGVTQFDFRFVYSDGSVSDPRSIAYYAHTTLWDTNKGTSSLLCPVLHPDSVYFEAARPYIASGTNVPAFAAGDVQLKNPFIRLRFLPQYIGDAFQPNTVQQEIKVSSLRHRFAMDAGMQMVLINRSYKSTRMGGCDAAAIASRDTTKTVSGTTTSYYHFHSKDPCEAIVINRSGAGVCLRTDSATSTVKLVKEHSSIIITFLNKLGIPWPKADPMMWSKLFDQAGSLPVFDFFTTKCATEDTACRAMFTTAPVLPDSSDVYFTTP